METRLVWHTLGGNELVAEMARVSNPDNEKNEATAPKLIAYLIKHKHWSPFEMVSACFEIKTTRDIGRQILRHRSFSFQEFSQRYAEVKPEDFPYREMRMKGTTNRQGSLNVRDEDCEIMATGFAVEAFRIYSELIKSGVAPECARAVLPEGYTPTRMYMTGTLRSWIHYCMERTAPVVQKEHRDIAQSISHELGTVFPSVWDAVRLILEEGAE